MGGLEMRECILRGAQVCLPVPLRLKANVMKMKRTNFMRVVSICKVSVYECVAQHPKARSHRV